MMCVMGLPDDAPSPRLVARSFGVPGEVIDMAAAPRAWSNRLYQLTTDRAAYAVKQLRNPWREHRWRDWLAAAWQFEQVAWEAGLSMPEPIPNPADGSCLAWWRASRTRSVCPCACTYGWRAPRQKTARSTVRPLSGQGAPWRLCTSSR
jgi:hypothetical protein